MAFFYGHAGRLTTFFGCFRPGQAALCWDQIQWRRERELSRPQVSLPSRRAAVATCAVRKASALLYD